MRDGINYAPSTFVGSASGIHFIRFVHELVNSSTIGKPSPASISVPGEDDRLVSEDSGRNLKTIWREGEVDIEHRILHQAFTFDELLGWSSTYFDAWHPVFPFLHAPSVLDSFEVLAREGATKLDVWQTIVAKALFSIALADRRQYEQSNSTALPSQLVFDTFDSVLDSVQPAMTQPATIASLQAVLSAQIFLLSMLRLNAASKLGGLIVRMAFQLGLHRCPAKYLSISKEEQQLRKRIFWTIYCVERHICHALGLPLTIRDDDVDVCYLDEEKHRGSEDAHRDASNNISEFQDPVFDARLHLLTLLSRHAKIRGSIMELRNKKVSVRNENIDKNLLINAELTKWSNEVEEFFSSNYEQTPERKYSRLHKAILETLKHECVIALNRPLLSLPKESAMYAGAIHTCISAAKSIISVLTVLLTSKEPLMWPSFTWAVWMSAFIVLYSSAEGQIARSIAERDMLRSGVILRRLATRGSVWPYACAVSVEDLMTKLGQHTKRRQAKPSLTKNSMRDSGAISRAGSGPNRVDTSKDMHPETDQGSHGPNQQQGLAQDVNASDSAVKAHSGFSRQHNRASRTSEISKPAPQSSSFSPVPEMQSHETPANFPWIGIPQSTTFDFGMNLDALPVDSNYLTTPNTDPFEQFDIPFWFGQDNYAAWMGS